MGKPTGFLEYERNENTWKSPSDRIQDFEEFKLPHDAEERRKQAARCMNCGVPFCQSALELNRMVTGCPLHNLVPEWNDAIYKNHLKEAYERLSKTNPYPEFTGRVCPALCEKACLNGYDGQSVTIHDDELFIIETAYANGWVKPVLPQIHTDKRIAIIGSGPSGLAAAHDLNQRGHHVTVFERENRPGGLLMYGIPNMKLNKKYIKRRIEILEAEGVEFKTNVNVGQDLSEKQLKKDYDVILLCTGSKKARDLNAKNRNIRGIYFAVDYLTQMTKHLLDDTDYINAKDKNVIIVGGGDTGNDCTGTAIRQGCASVTQLEMMPKAPDTRAADNPWPEWPKVCKTDYGQQESIFRFGKDPRIYETTIKEFISKDNQLTAVKTVKVSFKDGKLQEVAGSEQTLPCDLLLIAAGFVGIEDYVQKAFQLETTPRNTIVTHQYQTADEQVFAAGDARRGQSLVVWAIHEGKEAAKAIDRWLMGYTNL